MDPEPRDTPTTEDTQPIPQADGDSTPIDTSSTPQPEGD